MFEQLLPLSFRPSGHLINRMIKIYSLSQFSQPDEG